MPAIECTVQFVLETNLLRRLHKLHDLRVGCLCNNTAAYLLFLRNGFTTIVWAWTPLKNEWTGVITKTMPTAKTYYQLSWNIFFLTKWCSTSVWRQLCRYSNLGERRSYCCLVNWVWWRSWKPRLQRRLWGLVNCCMQSQFDKTTSMSIIGGNRSPNGRKTRLWKCNSVI